MPSDTALDRMLIHGVLSRYDISGDRADCGRAALAFPATVDATIPDAPPRNGYIIGNPTKAAVAAPNVR